MRHLTAIALSVLLVLWEDGISRQDGVFKAGVYLEEQENIEPEMVLVERNDPIEFKDSHRQAHKDKSEKIDIQYTIYHSEDSDFVKQEVQWEHLLNGY